MATAAPNQTLPLLYTALEPLNSTQHGKMKVRRLDKSPTIGKTHAIPATVDEFALLQRHYPIVFSVGDNPVPLALMGLNEGVNVFLDEERQADRADVYMPAYMRRYPFLLARLRPDSDDLSLCFDPTAGRGRRLRGRRAAVRRRPAERGDQGHPAVLRAVRDRRPAHRGLHGGAEEDRAC